MKIDAYFTVAEIDPASVGDATVVVIDVIRATTTIVEALANGARGIYPTASTEEAVKLAHSLGRDDTLLCGERKWEKVEGFDLGNSPEEFTRAAVEGKRLVMSTRNGTRAFGVGQEAARSLACAFTNIGAVADAVSDVEELVVLCAGREDRFSIDDALCGGHLIKRILAGTEAAVDLNDAANAAKALAGSRKPTARFLAATQTGRALIAAGFADDLKVCAQVDRHAVVAEMREQAIVLAEE